MGNASARHLAAICTGLLAATPATAQSAIMKIEGMTADQVMANLTTRCAGMGNAIENATNTMLVCVRQGGLDAMILFGTRAGARPVYRDRYIVTPLPSGVQLIATSTLDTMNALGGAQSRPVTIAPKDLETVRKVARGELAGLPFSAPDVGACEPPEDGPDTCPQPPE